MKNIVVIDTETTWSDEVMSLGAVIASGDDYRILDSRYYLIDPACRQSAMYASVLHLKGTPQERIGSRRAVCADLYRWLRDNGVEDIFAYNALFDKKHMPELSTFRWFDIMRIAAYRQYNRAIPRDALCCGTGRLKHDYGVQSMYRLLSGNPCYNEKHNGWYDAVDELKLMELLALPLETYAVAEI